MPTIRVDDEVFAEIKRRSVPYIDTPNAMLRRLLKLDSKKAFMTPDLFRWITRMKEEDETAAKATPGGILGPDPVLPDYKNPVISYKHSRLCFKAALIEPLNDHDVFEIVTDNDGTYRFSKSDFYLVFPNVVSSVSYRENGMYHYAKIPRKKAAHFGMEWEEQHVFAQKLIERAK